MYLSIWKDYKADCALYGWEPSFEGAVAYQREVKLGLREKWEGKNA